LSLCFLSLLSSSSSLSPSFPTLRSFGLPTCLRPHMPPPPLSFKKTFVRTKIGVVVLECAGVGGVSTARRKKKQANQAKKILPFFGFYLENSRYKAMEAAATKLQKEARGYLDSLRGKEFFFFPFSCRINRGTTTPAIPPPRLHRRLFFLNVPFYFGFFSFSYLFFK
jgi:hypothetical protein